MSVFDRTMTTQCEPNIFGLLGQVVTLTEWHGPNFGRYKFQATEDALRRIFTWETNFTTLRSGSLSERLYLPSLHVAEGEESGSGPLTYETDLDVMFLPKQAVIMENNKITGEETTSDELVSKVLASFVESSQGPHYVKLRVNTACTKPKRLRLYFKFKILRYTPEELKPNSRSCESCWAVTVSDFRESAAVVFLWHFGIC